MRRTCTFFLLGFATVILVVAASAFYFILSGSAHREEVTVTVASGSTAAAVAKEMKEKGLIRSELAMKLFLRIRGNSTDLKSGTYIISGPISLSDLISILVEGKSVSEDIRVTIPEGSTIADIESILVKAGVLKSGGFGESAFMNDLLRDLWILSDLKTGDILEGYLFPDTYNFLKDEDSDMIVRSMVENLQSKVAAIAGGKVPEGFSTYREWITLSSIVQNESPLEDMQAIAGVFRNRLDRGKRLESDATVNYFLGTSKLIPAFRDITVKNEYNTYLNPGLPPSPISNPGQDALKAAAGPDKHNYLFFLHTPDGKTILSETFDQHLKARARYWE